jgi:mRNA interferase RelE/StbE
VYSVEITPEGHRHLRDLPEKVRLATMKTAFAPSARNPQRVGKPLIGELDGLHSVRRGAYRIIYEILEDEYVVVTHRIQQRSDVHRSR